MANLELRHVETIISVLENKVPAVPVWLFRPRPAPGSTSDGRFGLALITRRPLPLKDIWALDEAFKRSDIPHAIEIVDWSRCDTPQRSAIERSREMILVESLPREPI